MFSAKNILDELMKGSIGKGMVEDFNKEIGEDLEGLEYFLKKKMEENRKKDDPNDPNSNS